MIEVNIVNDIAPAQFTEAARIAQAKLCAYLRGVPGCFEKVGLGKPPESGEGFMLTPLDEYWAVVRVENGEHFSPAIFTCIYDAVDFILVELPEFESCISEVSPFQSIVYAG